MWRNQMRAISRHISIWAFGIGLAISCIPGSMAEKMQSKLDLADVKCGTSALEKLDKKTRLGRIEECNSQTPTLDSGTLVAPIPTIVAAKSKGPKLRDKHLRAACPPPKTVLDALTAKRRKGPKGDVDHGCTESNPAPDVPVLKRRKGPKGAGSSDAQG
jgi:hypothetical protein